AWRGSSRSRKRRLIDPKAATLTRSGSVVGPLRRRGRVSAGKRPGPLTGLDPHGPLHRHALGRVVRGRGAGPRLPLMALHRLDLGPGPAPPRRLEPVGLALVAVGVDGLDGHPHGVRSVGLGGEDGVALARPGRAAEVVGEALAAALVDLALQALAERAGEGAE